MPLILMLQKPGRSTCSSSIMSSSQVSNFELLCRFKSYNGPSSVALDDESSRPMQIPLLFAPIGHRLSMI